jgi:hypothetical protein
VKRISIQKSSRKKSSKRTIRKKVLRKEEGPEFIRLRSLQKKINEEKDHEEGQELP